MRIEGNNNVKLRNVKISDAQFIMDLRTNSELNQHLSPVSKKLEDQISFLHIYQKKYQNGDEYYFIVEFKNKPVGTVRIYNIDKRAQTYTWGSWIVQRGNPGIVALSSAYLTYYFAFNYLNLNKTLIDVRKQNTSVFNLYQTYATVIAESELDYFLEFKKEDFWKFTKKFEKKIPTEVKVTF